MKYLGALVWIIICSFPGFSQPGMDNSWLACGHFNRAEAFESKYVDARNVDVWLPAGYDPNTQYPVLYMHDGQMLFDSSYNWNHQEWGVDETMCRLIAEKKIRECIVVGIWNNGTKRAAEYFPEKALEYLSPEGKKLLSPRTNDQPLADNYLKFIVFELKPEIDKVLPTLSDPANTFIAGSSMGGLISMYAICEYPDVFGGAACLSTHWPGIFTNDNNPIPDAILKYMELYLPNPKNHKIYFDYGTETIDSLYGVWQVKVDKLMQKKGFKAKSWITRVFPGENHSEWAWNKRLHIPLEFLLKTKN